MTNAQATEKTVPQTEEDEFARLMNDDGDDGAAPDDMGNEDEAPPPERQEQPEPAKAEQRTDEPESRPAPAAIGSADEVDVSALPPELQSHWKAMQTRAQALEREAKGHRERTPQLQQQITQANRRLAELEAQLKTAAPGNGAGNKQPAAGAGAAESPLPDVFTSAEWNNLREDYPDLAKVIEGSYKASIQEAAAARKLVEDFQKSMPGVVDERVGRIEQQMTHERRMAFTAKHPDWAEHVAFYRGGRAQDSEGNRIPDKMTPDFHAFYWGLPAEDRASIAWSDFEAMDRLMSDFKEWRGQRSGDRAASEAASLLAARRNQRKAGLAAAAAPIVRGGAARAIRHEPGALSEEEEFAGLDFDDV